MQKIFFNRIYTVVISSDFPVKYDMRVSTNHFILFQAPSLEVSHLVALLELVLSILIECPLGIIAETTRHETEELKKILASHLLEITGK